MTINDAAQLYVKMKAHAIGANSNLINVESVLREVKEFDEDHDLNFASLVTLIDNHKFQDYGTWVVNFLTLSDWIVDQVELHTNFGSVSIALLRERFNNT